MKLWVLPLAALLLASPDAISLAQTPAVGPQRVSVSADQGEATPGGFSLRGRAEVIQGDNRLRADAINGFAAGGDLRRVEATGNVYFVTPERTMRGDRAVYDLTTAEVVVTGDVILTEDQNVMTGGRLTYNVDTQVFRIEGASNGRVRGVFYPQGGVARAIDPAE